MYPLAITTSDRDIPATHRTSIHPWRSHQPGQLGPQDGPSQSWVPYAYRVRESLSCKSRCESRRRGWGVTAIASSVATWRSGVVEAWLDPASDRERGIFRAAVPFLPWISDEPNCCANH